MLPIKLNGVFFFFYYVFFFFSKLHSSRQKSLALFGKFVVSSSAKKGSCVPALFLPPEIRDFSNKVTKKSHLCKVPPPFFNQKKVPRGRGMRSTVYLKIRRLRKKNLIFSPHKLNRLPLPPNISLVLMPRGLNYFLYSMNITLDIQIQEFLIFWL